MGDLPEMTIIYVRGSIVPGLITDRPVEHPGVPEVPMIELAIGQMLVRVWPADDPAQCEGIAAGFTAIAVQLRERKVELLKKRQNLREDHRGEVSTQAAARLSEAPLPLGAPQEHEP